jgi:hypothetical protein
MEKDETSTSMPAFLCPKKRGVRMVVTVKMISSHNKYDDDEG